ncbi:omega-6 fatty acid desaturase (delta-12 desaturase) [Monaibacterium marinum]|uniref:Omega-6 fatty acid desaturase (Delta-12 desaturase) n=1 Tax=Pontivivens marinum TaxID=1690039 RepID=A0A2C9CUV9_9RHOB|nr:fatty acid desaturase [Monaibacterium marinum]SOH95146.1 omega-6 fatty acid desaturase (delta-12 desaturase) [Monaibacterium marinum]
MPENTSTAPARQPRDWIKVLAGYREPSNVRSSYELVISLIPFVALWVAACWVVQFSYLGAFVISAFNGAFLLRLFCIQHDCGHGSFFGNRDVSDWIGRALGVLTLTPYDVWRRSHSIHHSHAGDLDHRGIGDVMTLTIEEYHQRTPLGRLMYRAYRHPLVLFGLGPTYLFILQNRLPVGFMNQGRKYWISAMGTNVGILALLAAITYFGGFQALFLIFLPSTLVAASAGMWLFYIQHQFEDTHWDRAPDWQIHEAALHGSSHFDLPPVLRWFTANIGIHHVHHLYSRIPFYRLPEVLRDHRELIEVSRMTLGQSFKCASLDLWDEKSRRLVSFATARRMAA